MIYGVFHDERHSSSERVMNKDIFIDVTNILLGILAIFWFGIAVLPYMHPILP